MQFLTIDNRRSNSNGSNRNDSNRKVADCNRDSRERMLIAIASV